MTEDNLVTQPSQPIAHTEVIQQQNGFQNNTLRSKQPSLQQSLTGWQRFKQFQPSSRLVKVVLAWWLLVIVITALDITGSVAYWQVTSSIQPLYWFSVIVLLAITMVCFIDLIGLIVLSQRTNYSIRRDYPSNVPVFHNLSIDSYLTFQIIPNAPSQRCLKNYLKILGRLQGSDQFRITVDFYDEYPDQLSLLESMPIRLKLPLATSDDTQGSNPFQSQIKLSYPVLPTSRGTGYFGQVHLRIWSPLQLFRRSLVVAATDTNQKAALASRNHAHGHYLRVLADFSGLMSNHLSAIFSKNDPAGHQTLMQQGHGSDFLKLREYSAGDAIRQIDWKASSRLQRVMSKVYEVDNNQQLVFLLDCGEQMRHQDSDENISDIDAAFRTDRALATRSEEGTIDGGQNFNYFDKVLNAVLLLAYIANKQNDKVGLMTFGGVDVYLPPNNGTSLIRNMLNETADIKPTMQTSDYLMAAQSLTKKLKKRSLIILITNTRSEASSELEQAIKLLSRRHQVVFTNLMEQTVYERLHGDIIPTNVDDALLYHSLMSYEQSRQQLQQTLSQHTGTLCLQTTANRLPSTLTQTYLSLKRS